jgi:hypothetical protein
LPPSTRAKSKLTPVFWKSTRAFFKSTHGEAKNAFFDGFRVSDRLWVGKRRQLAGRAGDLAWRRWKGHCFACAACVSASASSSAFHLLPSN